MLHESDQQQQQQQQQKRIPRIYLSAPWIYIHAFDHL